MGRRQCGRERCPWPWTGRAEPPRDSSTISPSVLCSRPWLIGSWGGRLHHYDVIASEPNGTLHFDITSSLLHYLCYHIRRQILHYIIMTSPFVQWGHQYITSSWHHHHSPNGGIKPHIEYFIGISFQWNRSTPFQVSADTPWLQAVL